MKLELSSEFRDKVARMIEHFSTDENEATRSHQLIALLLNEIMDRSNYDVRYRAQPTNEDGKRPDFLIQHLERSFFIIEAKAALSSTNHKDQIKGYLKQNGLTHGCLSDGISWTMLEYLANEDRVKDIKNLVLTDPQKICDYVLSKI